MSFYKGADETYIRGKRKKDYDKEAGEPKKRGCGTLWKDYRRTCARCLWRDNQGLHQEMRQNRGLSTDY